MAPGLRMLADLVLGALLLAAALSGCSDTGAQLSEAERCTQSGGSWRGNACERSSGGY